MLFGYLINTLRRSRMGAVTLIVFALVLSLAHSHSVPAQQATSPPAIAPVTAPGTAVTTIPADDNRYRIGPGDVLSIVVRKAAELSGQVRVDQRGMIRIPMIDHEVRAACLTEGELANEIKNLYLEYKQNPSVDVLVADFQSRPVAVIGAINSAAQFRLQRRVRLLELLSFAGGPSNSAGRTINIIHTGEPYLCEPVAPANTTGVEDSNGIATYKLFDTLRGMPAANPYIQPGDIVRLLEADQVFVIGHVNSPGPIALKDRVITISKAIAMAGGTSRDGRSSGIRIIRQLDDSDVKKEIVVDLGAIKKEKAEDIVLMPNDVVEVGASAGKTILNMLTGAVPQAVTQSAVRVIP